MSEILHSKAKNQALETIDFFVTVFHVRYVAHPNERAQRKFTHTIIWLSPPLSFAQSSVVLMLSKILPKFWLITKLIVFMFTSNISAPLANVKSVKSSRKGSGSNDFMGWRLRRSLTNLFVHQPMTAFKWLLSPSLFSQEKSRKERKSLCRRDARLFECWARHFFASTEQMKIFCLWPILFQALVALPHQSQLNTLSAAFHLSLSRRSASLWLVEADRALLINADWKP